MTRAKKFYIFMSVVLVLTGVLIITFEIWSFLYLSNLRSEVTEQKYRTSKYSEKTDALTTLKGKYNSIKDDLSLIALTLPDQKDTSKLLSDLDQLAKESNIKLTLIQSNVTTKKDSGSDQSLLQTIKGKYSYELPLKLELEGPYTGVLEFIKKLERYQRLLNITSIEINKDALETGDFVKVKILLTAYLMK